MKSLYDYYPSNKGSDLGLKYLVEEDQEIKGARNKLKLFCPDCSKTFSAKPDKIFQGQLPCACGKNYYKTPELKLIKIQDYCLENNFKYLSTDRLIQGSHDRVDIKCLQCFNEWTPTYASLVNSCKGCPKCAGQYRYTDEEYITRINVVGEVNKFKFSSKLDNDKLRQHSHVTLSCNVCDGTWNASLGNILSSKYACPSCAHRGFNPVKRSLLYILKILNTSEEVVAYKYGITNNFKRRLENMRLSNSHTIEIVSTWGYEDGKVARIHENSIKKEFKSFLNKSELPDGHTETVDPEQLMKLYTFQSGQYLSETY
jgi:hypothetical protein